MIHNAYKLHRFFEDYLGASEYVLRHKRNTENIFSFWSIINQNWI